MRRILAIIGVLIICAPALLHAQSVPSALVHAARSGAQSAADVAAPTPGQAIATQAALEANLGIALYGEGDDFRAISALQRYRLLDGSDPANLLASLIIGQIYSRNDKPRQARAAYERAAHSAPDFDTKTWAALHANQESCIALDLWVVCDKNLQTLRESPPVDPLLQDIITYQSLFTGVVLRKDALHVASISDTLLAQNARELLKRDAEFHDLDLQTPWLAGVLSGVLPGAGQAYNGRWADAGIALALTGGAGAATYYAFVEAESIPWGVAAGVLTAGFWVGGIVNAVTDAHRINHRVLREYFRRLEEDLWPRVHLVVQNNQVIFGYTF